MEGISEGIITALINGFMVLLGGIIAGIIGYFVNRRQQSANVARTRTDTRIAEGVAEVASEKQLVEVRLVEIEAKQADLAYHQKLVTDLQTRVKEADAERAIEQATLRAQVAAIEAVQAEAKNLHDSHITELLTSIEGMVASLGEADAKIVVLQKQVADGNELIAGLQEQVEGSNLIITTMQEEMKKDKAVIAELREQIQSLLVQSVDKAEAANATLTKKLE